MLSYTSVSEFNMATQIKTWQIVDNKLQLVQTSLQKEGKTEPYDLEEWIASNPEILGQDIVVIGRQVLTRSGPLDLLGIDKVGNLVIIELKRDRLPRDVIAQVIDYASDVATWGIDKVSELSVKHTGKSLEDVFSEYFPDIDLESLNVNESQRILLVGFSIDSALERMISWLSDSYGVNINALLLSYIKTKGGDELLTQTAIIPEEIEQENIKKKKKFQIPMSDEPGHYDTATLKQRLTGYLSLDMYSSRRLRDVLLPACLNKDTVTRDELKQEFVNHDPSLNINRTGYFVSLISVQIGMQKNDFLRQVIGYDYPNYHWEKDNYRIREEYKVLVKEVLDELSRKIDS
jgi:hypothetical protein